jgi:hypothetical protein
MSQIPASYRELANAYHSHVEVSSKGTSMTHKLVLFYCVECGLKSIYLHWNGLQSTDQLDNETEKFGHNLREWAKKLHLSAELIGGLDNLRLNKNDIQYSAEYAHQIWRYGIRVRSEDEKCLVDGLINMKDWIKDQI